MLTLIIQLNINHLFAQLNGFKYSKWLNSSIWPIDGIQTCTTTLGQRGLVSNNNEGVLWIKLLWPEIRRTPTHDTRKQWTAVLTLLVYTVISTTGDWTSDHRLQNWNSTNEPTVHIAHKWCKLTSHGNCTAN